MKDEHEKPGAPADTVERVDPKTGEVTYVSAEEAAEVPIQVPAEEGQAAEPATLEEQLAAAGYDGPEPEPAPEPERVHAYDAGEFHPELNKLEGQMRDFMLTRIKNNWKPWQQMTVDEQRDLVNAIEQQARDTIRGVVRALNDYEWPHCMVTLGQVTIKGVEKGIEGKITAPMLTENLEFLGQHVEQRVMIVVTDAEAFFGADRVKYDGRGSQMDLPLGGNVKDAVPDPAPAGVDDGGFADEEAAAEAAAAVEALFGADPEGDEPTPPDPWPDDAQLGERQDDDTAPGEA